MASSCSCFCCNKVFRSLRVSTETEWQSFKKGCLANVSRSRVRESITDRTVMSFVICRVETKKANLWREFLLRAVLIPSHHSSGGDRPSLRALYRQKRSFFERHARVEIIAKASVCACPVVCNLRLKPRNDSTRGQSRGANVTRSSTSHTRSRCAPRRDLHTGLGRLEADRLLDQSRPAPCGDESRKHPRRGHQPSGCFHNSSFLSLFWPPLI